MTRKTRAKKGGPLRIIPLGGCGEIGLNMTVIEYQEQILVVDCGNKMPEEDMPGVDLVLPDVSYLEERREKILGILITHGHEDHIGALPYLLPKLDAPVFATSLPLEMLKKKLVEHELEKKADLRLVEQRKPLELGCFRIEWVNVTHSMPNSSALLIETPLGLVVHSGDYKIDDSPVDGQPFDFYSLTRAGEEGVLLLLSDSTNVGRAGATPSETAVIPHVERHFQNSPGSLIFATFSSALHRVQVVLDLAEKYGRKVFLSGLNMERNIEIAGGLGFLDIPPKVLQPIREYPKTPPAKRVALTTGSQGEPFSGLMRMSLDEHKYVQVQEGDTVLISARIIPGNERAIYRMVNHFFRRGARVIDERAEPIHASGHAYSHDMRLLLNMLRPAFLIPVHGEIRHLLAHKHLAVDVGMDPHDVFVMENGDVLEIFDEERARIAPQKALASRVLVDGRVLEDVHEVVLRDRLHLAEDGVVLILLTIAHQSASLLAEPEIVSRGFVNMDESEQLIRRLKQVVVETFQNTEKEGREEWAVVKEAVRRAARKFLKKETQRFPVILPVVTEI